MANFSIMVNVTIIESVSSGKCYLWPMRYGKCNYGKCDYRNHTIKDEALISKLYFSYNLKV